MSTDNLPLTITIDPLFSRLLERQRSIQQVFIGDDPGNLPDARKMAFVMETGTALIHEVVEAMNETGWKPWASSNHINREAYREELADVYIFLMNMMLIDGMTTRELAMLVDAKQAKNLKRQQQGYTGVTEKCPGCQSALDGAGIGCYRLSGDHCEAARSEAWCDKRKEYIPLPPHQDAA